MNDEQLVSTYRESGNTDLLEELMSRHLGRVRKMVFRMVLNDGIADDLTQDVFLKAFRNLESFRGNSQFSTWLYRVTINVVHDFFRKQERSKVEFREQAPQSESADQKPEQSAMATELYQEVQQALGELSPALRSAMVLTVFEQMSPKEAAAVENCTLDTMYWRIHEARKQLKQRLQQHLS